MTSVLLLHIMMCLMIRILSTFMQVWNRMLKIVRQIALTAGDAV